MSSSSASRPRISELRLRNFRSFADARLPLDDFTILVGRNGAGKSNILDAFDFLSDALRNSLQTAMERRGNLGSIVHRTPSPMAYAMNDWEPVELAIEMTLPPPVDSQIVYGFSLKGTTEGFYVEREELQTYPKRSFSFVREGIQFSTDTQLKNARLVPDPKSLILPLIAGQERVWALVLEFLRNVGIYDLSPHAMQLEPPIGDTLTLKKSGDNLGDVVQTLTAPEHAARMEWILSHLRAIVPDINSISAQAAGGRRGLQFNIKIGEHAGRVVIRPFRETQVSNGTLRGLGVLVALRQPQTPSLILLDEIESSVHPCAVAALMDAAMGTSEELTQVVLSTHDPDALSHPSVTADNLRIVEWRDGKSSIFLLGEGTRELLGTPPESVGRLLRANALWPADDPCILGEHGIFAEPK